MQRDASVSASAGGRPRFTSSKLRLRTLGSASGMCVRRILIRSFSGSMLRMLVGSTLLSDIMLLLCIRSSAQMRNLIFLCGQIRPKLRQLLILVFFEVSQRLALLFAIHGIALHQDFKVDQRGVELGSIDAGELALVTKQHTAAAAHSGAVHHDGVEADHGLDAEGFSDSCDGAHHGHRANREHKVDSALSVDEPVQLHGHQALLTVTAVVGHYVGFVARLANFVFKHHHLRAACAFNKDDVIARLLEGVGGGQRHGRSHAAGKNHNSTVFLDFRGVAEGTNDVENRVACFKAVEQRGGFADGLHNNGDGTGSRIGTLDGERNALALLMQAENKELPWLLLAGNARRLDDKLLYIEADRSRFHDLIHEGVTPVWSTPRQRASAHDKAIGYKKKRITKRAGAAPPTNLIIEDRAAWACDMGHWPDAA